MNRRESSGEIVVAHRATEGAVNDVLTDASMVTSRTNPQAADALALTKNAMDIAKDVGKRTGHQPEVTVTGHSLGGALAQVSAHHYDLKGETFNAYGAASLNYRIPEGGNSLINHVMASDPVSAASPHFGQVRMYAKPDEIATLSGAGYSNSKANFLIPDYPLVAAGRSLGAHMLGNFLGEHSALKDPGACPLAEKNARMIDEYRRDIDGLRTGTTILTRSARGLGQEPSMPSAARLRRASRPSATRASMATTTRPCGSIHRGMWAMRCSTMPSAVCMRRMHVQGARRISTAHSYPVRSHRKCMQLVVSASMR
ncbi:lipase [Xanthomonas oryzae pv. oryzae]|uniref:Lipase n=1 Tax=Xanthomonas oryzae pv. oryzae TaxID=64187 RepID=A0A854CJC9_XANOO|nr:lipase [Xanthomonas oryzae pv. oryzae]OLG35530.1 lipase [Xanthomonas oryzae pv. oryzae]OLG56061.1 lipase [Xanthomonas oryzae pv. oryzae]OLG57707.1 lipase [Xanthomonas oryzae pv. oryzae]OLG64221.1 lipase [Xanthomonas oryzae pv. oryzae]